MAGALPEPYIPDINRTLANYGTGYGLGKEMRMDNALSEAGKALRDGDQTGARNALYEGGQVQEGLKLEDHFRQVLRQADADKLAKAQRANETLGNLALAADTPEKWQAAIGAAKQAGLDVDKWSDFGTRSYVLAQGKKTVEMLNMEAERRKQESDAALKREAIQARTVAAQTKAAQAARPKPRNLSFGDTKKLAEQGVQLENVKRYGGDFKDEFAGYGRGGDTAMWTARNLPFLTGETTEKAAGFWQDYDRYKNKVRNELFGSALTAPEAEAFEKADVQPNMDPKLIRQNLLRQKQAAESALAKLTKALTASGFNPEAIEGAVGVPLDELNGGNTPLPPGGFIATKKGPPTQVRSKQQYDALPPGAEYIAPDGSTRTKQ